MKESMKRRGFNSLKALLVMAHYYQLSNSRSVGNNRSGWTMSYILIIDQSGIKDQGGQNVY